MATGRAEGGKRAAALSAALLLAGCADPLVNRPTGEIERWGGRAEAVAGGDGPCGAVEFELFRDALSIGGRAREAEAKGEGVFAAVQSWWVEGTVNPNGTFLFSLRRQGPLLGEGPRPASVWRGRFGSGEVVAVEQPPSCGRRVRLVREASGAPAS
jgi:hypothetical protein